MNYDNSYMDVEFTYEQQFSRMLAHLTFHIQPTRPLALSQNETVMRKWVHLLYEFAGVNQILYSNPILANQYQTILLDCVVVTPISGRYSIPSLGDRLPDISVRETNLL